MVAMPLYIRDDEVRRMAQRLAEAKRTTVTDAVREALRRELEAVDATLAERDRRLRGLFAKWEQEPPAGAWGDDDMYDEHGIPR
jgi:antitoxin VapB